MTRPEVVALVRQHCLDRIDIGGDEVLSEELDEALLPQTDATVHRDGDEVVADLPLRDGHVELRFRLVLVTDE